ncbi:MAG TPA: arsenic resistance N-acetyltransferase ArsN2 [Kiritimatiellia bacterium]|nr:arsenic resistance N-acetyltransferase ArsN2 [Kiritimatiellia bacterium]
MSETEAPFRILPAAAADWPEIAALLAANHLPTADVDASRAGDFLVARDARGLAGCIGGERRGAYALLRSLAVREDCRGRGIGKRLTSEMELRCKSAGVQAAYILTETAAKFAEGQGYLVVERLAVPGEIRSTKQFSGLCPCCATCMAKTL